MAWDTEMARTPGVCRIDTADQHVISHASNLLLRNESISPDQPAIRAGRSQCPPQIEGNIKTRPCGTLKPSAENSRHRKECRGCRSGQSAIRPAGNICQTGLQTQKQTQQSRRFPPASLTRMSPQCPQQRRVVHSRSFLLVFPEL